MGQIIRLPIAPADFPDTAARLDLAEGVLLSAIRAWVAAYRQNEDPIPRLVALLADAGAGVAAYSIDALMAVVARTLRRQIAIHCPRCPHLSDDEKHLLHVASLVQHSELQAAERALRTALLSVQGAEFALGPLQGLGDILAEARLCFRLRSPPTKDRRTTTAMHPETMSPKAVH